MFSPETQSWEVLFLLPNTYRLHVLSQTNHHLLCVSLGLSEVITTFGGADPESVRWFS